jgi:hypothetical protein
MSDPNDYGGWLVYPEAGDRVGEGGDCYAVAYFGDDELEALRYMNRNRGTRAIYVKPGQTISEALEKQQ